MQSEMQQRLMIMIERLQNVTDDIKADSRAARLKPSSPASDTKSQIEDSARALSGSVSPSEQLRVTLRDSGNFDEFKTPAALRKVDVADKPVRKKVSRRESQIITSLRYNVTEAESVQVVNMKTAEPFKKRLLDLTPTAFLWWYTKWNEHIIRHKTCTPPTSLVTQEIREIL